MNAPAVQCLGLAKSYGRSRAVKGLDLTIAEGTTLVLLGPSGSGKTTALRLVAGFEVPDAGVVEIAGQRVAGPGVYVPPEQRRIGMVFQDYALFPHLSVASNVGFGIADKSSRDASVIEALDLVGLAGLGSRMPHELSGGQQQRVALARALAPRPAVLLMDEPFSNLDAGLRAQVRTEVRAILQSTNTTALFVTHDQDEALYMGDQVAVLDWGELQQVETPEGIYHTPATRFVAKFLGLADFIPATFHDGELETALGTVAWNGEPPPAGVEALLRPDDMSLEPSESGQGVIISRVFQGPSYLYEVALNSGGVVHVLQHHTRQYDVGARVQVRIIAEHRLACFLGEQRVG